MSENNNKLKKPETKLNSEARQNAVAFFDLLLKIALRENIDIGQFENNNKEIKKYD
jgi:hypothetical protein